MTLQFFLTGLLLVSILTGLVTEAIKRILEEQGKQYYSNTLAGIVAGFILALVAVVIAVLVDIGYTVLNNMAFDVAWVVYLIALIGLSWLCAMVGYDKVIQALAQIRSK